MIEAPCFYACFIGRGHNLLADELGDLDPFTRPGGEIVERVLAAGYTPDLDQPWREPFPTADNAAMVHRDGQEFIVSVDSEMEIIAVQERGRIRGQDQRAALGTNQ